MGRSNAAAYPIALGVVCALFVGTSLAGDSWDTKRIRGAVGAAMVEVFEAPMVPSLDSLVVAGHCATMHESYPYRVAAEIASWLLGTRTASLRGVSLLFGCVFLVLMSLVGEALYDRSTGLLCALILATSPFVVEMLRAYGYISMTLAIAAAIVLLSARNLRDRVETRADLGWAAVNALLCLSTLSVYAVGRLVLVVPFVAYACRARSRARSALAFVAVFALPIAVLLAASPAARSSVADAFLVGPEWLSHPDQVQPASAEFHERLARNVPDALGQLSLVEEVMISDFGADCRLYSWAYLPLLLAGVGFALARRRARDLLVAVSLVAFMGIPLVSSGLPARRVIFTAIPLYLLIASGGVGLFGVMLARLRGPAARRVLVAAAAAWIGLAALAGVHEFVTRLARSEHDVTAASQALVADMVEASLDQASVLIYSKGAEDLFFGNPVLINGERAAEVARKISLRHPDPVFWSRWSCKTGLPVAFFHVAEEACDGGGIAAHLGEMDVEVLLQASLRLDSQGAGAHTHMLCGEVFTGR